MRLVPRMRSGSVERVRKDYGADRRRLFAATLREFARFRQAARVPADVFVLACECAAAEAEDLLFDECPSWVDDPNHTWHDGDRGRPADESD